MTETRSLVHVLRAQAPQSHRAPPPRLHCSCAFHWDNISAPRQLLIRPAAPGWPWSGAFPLPEREDYFGLRLRHRCARARALLHVHATCAGPVQAVIESLRAAPALHAESCGLAAAARIRALRDARAPLPPPPALLRSSAAAVIIPVNTTVGRAGSVLITFKPTSSVPPYRIENRTKAVMLSLRQQVEAGGPRGPGAAAKAAGAAPVPAAAGGGDEASTRAAAGAATAAGYAGQPRCALRTAVQCMRASCRCP